MNLIKKNKVKKEINAVMSNNIVAVDIINDFINSYNVVAVDDLERLNSVTSQILVNNTILLSMLDGMNNK